MENINIFPMVYKHRIDRHGMVPLVICITLNNKPVAYDPLKRRIMLSCWDAEKREVKKGAPNAYLVNALIRKRVAELDKEFTQQQIIGITVTKTRVKDQVKGLERDEPLPLYYIFCLHLLRLTFRVRFVSAILCDKFVGGGF